MHKTKNNKKIPSLEPFFENVLVCRDSKLRPFIEFFINEPENIIQEKLGTIFGILEIKDDSEDSSYIVNYLISVIKKEYFSKPKRGSIESFEAALHKANLALSKLAEHGSISWIGKFNAIIGSIEKNNIHISQAGKSCALLIRLKSMSEISEGLGGEDIEPYPLKTFENVASGRLEEGDKIILATESIFEIFSFEEIKKSALNFSKDQFLQFIKTALNIELERAAVILVEIKEKKEIPALENIENENEELNVFSSATFSKPTAQKEMSTKKKEDEVEKKNEKRGHIYIKETENFSSQNPIFQEYLEIFQDKTSSLFHFLKTSIVSLVSFSKDKFFKIYSVLKKRKDNRKDAAFSNNSFNVDYASAENQKNQFSKKYLSGLKIIYPSFKNFLPNFSKIKNIFISLDYQKRLYAILVIILVFIIPLFFVKFQQNKSKKEKITTTEEFLETKDVLLNEKNIIKINSVRDVLELENPQKIVNVKEGIFIIENDRIVNPENKEEYSVPENFGNIDLACPMDDLNLIFILNKQSKKIISFSPTSKKFQENSIIFPENSEASSIETFLTYLYVVDSKNGNIYRYPRAEGGFGEKTNWKRDEINIENFSEIAINENLFMSDGKSILKFFRGKKQDFSLEETITPISASYLFTKRNSENLYILDRENSRIIKADNTGKIVSQFYNPEIANSKSFVFKETLKRIYFLSGNNLKYFETN